MTLRSGNAGMSGHLIGEIDFEHWSTLASTDPRKFEELRQNKILALINNSNSQRKQRLLGLQWQIDTIRARHKDSTVAACLAISQLMWETFNQLSDVLQAQTDTTISPGPSDVTENIVIFPEKPEN